MINRIRYNIYIFLINKRDQWRFFKKHVKDTLTTIRPDESNFHFKENTYQCENCYKLFNENAINAVCPHCTSNHFSMIHINEAMMKEIIRRRALVS